MNIEKRNWQGRTALFLLGQVMSVLGSSLVMYAIIWHITITTDSGTMMMIAMLCMFIPQILVSLFAGVWADRFNRKWMIILADGGIALFTLLLAILFINGHNELWLLFAVSTVRSIGSGIQSPAIFALITQLVPEDKFAKVNGINGSLQSLIMLLSPALGAILLDNLGLYIIFFVDVATAGIAIILLLMFKVPNPPKITKRGYFDDMKQGLLVIAKHKPLRTMLIFSAVIIFLVSPAGTLGQLLVKRTFSDELWRLSANEMAFSLGAIIGGMLAGFVVFKTRIRTLIVSSLNMGIAVGFSGAVPLVLLSLGVHFEIVFACYLLVMIIIGILVPFINVNSVTLTQESVEPEYFGRVFSISGLITSSAFPLGIILFGPLADYVDLKWIMVATGSLIVFAAMIMLTNKNLKGFKNKVPIKESKKIEKTCEEI